MLDQQTLDQLWNFVDPALSEARFRAASRDPSYGADERAELTTALEYASTVHGERTNAGWWHCTTTWAGRCTTPAAGDRGQLTPFLQRGVTFGS